LFFELRLFAVIITEMAEEKKSVDLALAGFYEAMKRTNVEKITDEMLAGLSGDSSGIESFDVESENEDVEDQPWRPSHVFEKSTVKQGQIEAMKAGLRFPLHKMLVEVLKIFEIYLQQLTPEALIKVGVFIWAMRSQGLELDANCFCNIHELSYQPKAIGKKQYHNNFRCYSFVYRSDVRCHVLTFRKKMVGLMDEAMVLCKMV
jgi:hypothetical protein